MGLHTSRHTRKNSSFSTQDKHMVLLGLEALPYASHLHYATCSKLIVDQGHGGTILVVPDAAGDWLASIDPFAFKFSAPDNTAQECIRQYLKENQSQGETVLRVSSSNLSDEDKMIVFL